MNGAELTEAVNWLRAARAYPRIVEENRRVELRRWRWFGAVLTILSAVAVLALLLV